MYQRNNFSRNRFSRRTRQPKLFNPEFFIKNAVSQPKLAVVPIVNSLDDFMVSNQIKQNAKAKGYVTPTPIQDKAIPEIIQGKDVVGVANTGTGKTAAFLIPLIDKVAKNPNEKVLIITPTRELAAQIEMEFRDLSQNLNLYSTLCIGGSSMGRQIQRLKRNPNFVIGTPGRLKDLLERHMLKLHLFTVIVLDEVDRMLDMGFIHDVQHLISALPRQRQSLFFSATLGAQVRQVMTGFLSNPVIISVQTRQAAENVEQQIVKIQGRNKIDVLHDLLIQPGFDKVLIFGRTKWGIEKLSQELVARGFRATALHGNKSQGQRQRALDQFKRGQVKILLATDVAQRGLDIDAVSHVINFDLPQSQEDYIHRIGRTGRADKTGVAISLVP
jgi:superfamily II DNA/RNA helicase